ncbi:PspA/IM30 family protein [Methylorubrum podarium]|uniref:PspA/IM30 family protein n=1 Tax=Methylorubrum podarium TaxID=200476 RepID=A0ABV1QLB6_9HYPH
MLTLLRTLARGAAAQACEDAYDRHALLVLDQQIRETAADLERGRRTLAAAMAGDAAEARRLAEVEARAADLETRAVAALSAGREDLAREAAEAIATLEAERDALRAARATFSAEVTRMRAVLADATRRQAALERGRRVAAAAEAVRRLRGTRTVSGNASLREAEATLARLRRNQAEATDADAALAAIETPEETIAERLEREGFGPRTRPTSDDVLARLRSRAEADRAATA